MSTEMLKNKKSPLSHQKTKCLFLDYVQLLMIGQVIWAKNINRNAKNKKGPLSHQKIKCSFWITFNFWWSAEWSEQEKLTEMQKNEKGPLSHQKIKCLSLDYIQFLMTSQASQWTRTPSDTPLQPKKWNVHFWITLNCRWSAEQSE